MRRRTVLLLAVITMILLVVASPAWAAEFTVTNTADPGNGTCDAACTLREAITASNAAAGPDIITFNIGNDGGVKTISPTSPLPDITEAVTINGYSQLGANPNTLAVGNDAVLKVQLNGTNAGTGFDVSGLTIAADDSTIRGLAITGFARSGIVVEGFNTTGNKIEGNFIGTDAGGTAALGNGDGVDIQDADNTTVGGTAASTRNLVSGNKDAGIQIVGDPAKDNRVLGNYIGTDKNGTSDLGNLGRGIIISDAKDSTVGGTVSGARNVISGNNGHGVQIQDNFTIGIPTRNKIEGNFIGTNASGTAALGNDKDGVVVDGADLNRGGKDNIIGGMASGAGNLIANNGEDGVEVLNNASTGNSVLSNSVFANTGLGIDLGGDGRTDNDDKDLDPGPNLLQNFPVVTTAQPTTVTQKKKKKKKKKKRTIFLSVIAGNLNSTPNTTFTVQLFRNSSGEDEGTTLLTQFTSVTTDSNGNASFGTTVPQGAAPVGSNITATATDSTSGNTSEFSAAKAVG